MGYCVGEMLGIVVWSLLLYEQVAIVSGRWMGWV